MAERGRGRRILAAILRGVSRFFVVVGHVGSGLSGGRSTDEAARALYEKSEEYRP